MKKFLFGILIVAMLYGSIFAASTSVSGNWKITMQSPRGEHTNDMKIVQEGEKLQVTIQSPRGEQSYAGTCKEAEITWSGTRQTPDGREMTLTFQGKVEGDTMKGTAQMGDRGSFPWNAVRVK
jgi:hypothetical protein